MILYHIPDGAGLFVITCTSDHAYSFSNRYLHMINKIFIPQGLKYIIGKTKHHHILYSFFTQVMINAVQLFFGKTFQ